MTVTAGGPGLRRSLPPVWNVPFRRRPLALTRPGLAQAVDAAFADDDDALPVLTGPEGVGKTEVAVEYAYAHRADLDVVWWVRAGDVTTLRSDLAALGLAVGVDGADHPDLALAGEAVREWLECSSRWLLVADAADGPDADLVAAVLPRRGRVLVTARGGQWPAGAQVLAVGRPGEDEAVDFLLRRTGGDDRLAATSLARDLGCQPTALEQAGAYLAETPGIGLTGYRFLLLARAAELSPRTMALPFADPVAATSALALDRVEQMAPAGATVLRASAFLDGDAVPMSVFGSDVDELPEPLTDDAVTLDEGVAALHRLSLVSACAPDTISVSRSVQGAVRAHLSAGGRSWAAGALRLVAGAFPADGDDGSTWPRCAELLPHALAVTAHDAAAGVEPQATSGLLARAATYQQSRAQTDSARRLLERAVTIAEVSYGPDDPEAGAHLADLATVLWDAGDLAEARACLERALAIAEVTYGADHPTTGGLLLNVGRVRGELGDGKAARSCLERALAIDELTCGPHHPSVAADLTHLALVLRDLGEADEARRCFERALAIDEAAFGPNHPTVGADSANLALLLQDQGAPDAARPALERAVAIAEITHGANHPAVGAHLNNLATVLQDLGELDEARACLLRCLRIARSSSGADGLDGLDGLDGVDQATVASVLNNLGGVLGDMGHVAEAHECFQEALAIDELALGSRHPTVLAIRANQERLRRRSGRLSG